MTKDSKPSKDAKPKRQAPPQPAYVQFQGGFQSGRGNNSDGSGGNRPTGGGSPIRKSAPSGGGK